MFENILTSSGGGGGPSLSSGADSSAGPVHGAPVNVTVGGFNPPALAQLNNTQAAILGGFILLGVLLWARRK